MKWREVYSSLEKSKYHGSDHEDGEVTKTEICIMIMMIVSQK